MPERQRHAKIANEMADRLQRSADVPRWNKSERQNHRRMGRGSRDDIRTSNPALGRARAHREGESEADWATSPAAPVANPFCLRVSVIA